MRFPLFGFLILGIALALTFAFAPNKERLLSDEKYKLVWNDEFLINGTPDEKK